MHTLFLYILSLACLKLVQADSGKARVTQAPAVPKIFRRQNDICPPGAYTLCPDGYGCCELGAPCTTIRGEPACDTECFGLPCGEAGLCCDAVCTSSLGTAICVHPSTTGLGGFGEDDEDSTVTLDDPTTTSVPVVSTGSVTRPTTPSDTTEDFPTIATPTVTSGPSSGDDDEDEGDEDTTTTTTQARPTVTNVPSGADDDDESSTDTTDDEEQSGGSDTDGAGVISAKGTMALLVLALVGGAFLLH
ncbi:hypothetical protein BDV12DRAFT_202606 [Aspergillus spectabilis]